MSRWTKTKAERWANLRDGLADNGITDAELDALLRCERALQRWAERESGDGSDWAIERDEASGKPFNVYHGPGESQRFAIADREAGALRRAVAIAEGHGLTVFHQGDCRGCMLYLIRPGDVPAGEEVGAYYNRGVEITVD